MVLNWHTVSGRMASLHTSGLAHGKLLLEVRTFTREGSVGILAIANSGDLDSHRM